MAIDDTYTKVLLHMNGTDGSTTFTDESGKSWTIVNHAQIDTGQSKFGGASMQTDSGGDDYIYTADHDDFAFGSGDFTIDFWWRMSENSVSKGPFAQRHSYGDTHSYSFSFNAAGNLAFVYTLNGTTVNSDITWAWSPSANTWYHIAIVRYGATITMYIDGVAKDTSNVGTGSIYDSNHPFYICGTENSGTVVGYCKNSWIDEFRVSKGIARWTGNFTPPTSEYVAAFISHATII